MPQSAPSKTAGLVVHIAAVALTAAQPVTAQSAPAQLMDQLPSCSALRAEMARGALGDGVDQPYMRKMREAGIERALLLLDVDLRGGKPYHVGVARRLYFRQLDRPDSQVSDEATLKAIETSGLAPELDHLARGRVLAAPLVRGEAALFPSGRASSAVDIFANPWLPQHNPVMVRSGRPTKLALTVVNGDALGTRLLLESHKFTRKDLDLALFEAVLSQYDNSAVIKLLLNAGADVNARSHDGSTPLMVATARPCNLRPLLGQGADLHARDEGGRTALRVARETKEDVAIRLLLEAGAKESK